MGLTGRLIAQEIPSTFVSVPGVTLLRPRHFRKAIKGPGSGPRTITLDGYAASHRAVREMKSDGELPADTKLRSSTYLNNLIEKDHRGVKLRISPMLEFKRFKTAAVIIEGIELLLRIRKGQSAASSGSTCACCLGCSLGSPIKRQDRAAYSHNLWLIIQFAPEPGSGAICGKEGNSLSKPKEGKGTSVVDPPASPSLRSDAI